MTHDESIESRHAQIRPNLVRLREEVEFSLKARVHDEQIKTHSITGRVKELPSILEKVQRKPYSDPLNELPDLVGVRVVCLFVPDVGRITDIVQQTFDVVEFEDKSSSLADNEFGYESVHLVASLSPNDTGARYRGLHGLRFEVQVRTLLMDAWANVSHYLDYKGEASIPNSLRRDFYALSGLFYVADQHFRTLYEAAKESEDEAKRAVSGSDSQSDLPLNLDTLQAYAASRFPDRKRESRRSISELLEELTRFEIFDIGDLDSRLAGIDHMLAAYELTDPPASSRDDDEFDDVVDNAFDPNDLNCQEPEDDVVAGRYSEVGAIRIGLSLADANYARQIYQNVEPYIVFKHDYEQRQSDSESQ